MSYAIKVNLTSLKGATICPIRGRHSTKKCLVIPIEDAGLVEGPRGLYLLLNATEYAVIQDWTHVLRQTMKKDEYKALTLEQRKSLPNLGVMREIHPATISPDEMGELFDNNLLNF
ncbi:MAG: hypothetical protein IJR13_07660 [Bacteroidales bacterium]|nr:hypothetical protein [Bacteroidales bacterium]